jgi:hypothetical protein
MNYDDQIIQNEHDARGWNDGEFECTECGSPVDSDGVVCSGKCFEASML